MSKVGILAYGSLIGDPGIEIEPLIAERISTQTPFPVEYARLSKSRGGGPTVVPFASGKSVHAEILALKHGVSLEEARALLWRRETRKEGTGKTYVEGQLPGSVLVKEWPSLEGFSQILYTDFLPSGKLPDPVPKTLARAACASVAEAKLGMDGISYLMQLVESGVETTLTAEYHAEVLRQTGRRSLLQALAKLQGDPLTKQLERRLCERTTLDPDGKRYFARIEDSLIPGVHRHQFEQNLRTGAGCELDGKFLAVRSSSALAVNTFAPFKSSPNEMPLLGRRGYEQLCFEKTLPTGLRGTPPHLDVWLEGEHGVVGIESKLLEYVTPKQAQFKDSYSRTAFPWAEKCWWGVLENSKLAGARHLDVAQLVKHYLGLRNYLRTANGKSGTLLYLFWEPINAAKVAVCRQHRLEIEELAGQVAESEVEFKWMAHNQLWEEWSAVPALAAHARNLKSRYAVCI